MIRIAFAERCGLVAVDRSRLGRVLERILADHGLDGLLSVALVDDETIRDLHRRFFGSDTPTDVISFPLDDTDDPAAADAESPFAEVVVSLETAQRVATERGLSPPREAALYAIHGTLHLAGYDDLDDETSRVMRAKEKEYLALYGSEP